MRIPVLLALSLWPAIALAQAPPPLVSGEPETVYSDAQRQKDDTVARRTVMGVLAPADTTENQYARWKEPVCFNVYGLTPLAEYQAETRMKEIARKVGAVVNPRDDCAPNILIAFTSDPQATLDSIAKVRPWLVPGLGMIRSRTRETLPIQAWYALGMKGGTGKVTLVYDGYEYEPQYVPLTSLTRLDTGLETSIMAVTLVVDTKAIMGMKLDTLADYFALHSLAQIRPTRACQDVQTISNRMHAGCDPATITDTLSPGDLALLTAIYRTPDDSMAVVQGQRIIGNMRRILESQATHQDIPVK